MEAGRGGYVGRQNAEKETQFKQGCRELNMANRIYPAETNPQWTQQDDNAK